MAGAPVTYQVYAGYRQFHSAGLNVEPPSEVDYCGDSYLIQAWPSAHRERVLLKGFAS